MDEQVLEQAPAGVDGAIFQMGATKLKIEVTNYGVDGRIALLTKVEGTGEPWGKLTVNIEGAELAPGEFAVRDWEESAEHAAAAMASGLFEDTGRRIPTGFVTAGVWRFKPAAEAGNPDALAPFSGPCPLTRGDTEPDVVFAQRVQAHYGTDRIPSAIKSLAQIRRLRDLAEKDPKYTKTRFDADLALTNIASLPERLHPKK